MIMCAVPSRTVFSSSLTSCFSDMIFRYFLNEFEIIEVAPIIYGITFVFSRTLYFCSKVFVFQNIFGFFLDHIPIS